MSKFCDIGVGKQIDQIGMESADLDPETLEKTLAKRLSEVDVEDLSASTTSTNIKTLKTIKQEKN